MGRPITTNVQMYLKNCMPSDDEKLFLAKCKAKGIPKMTATGVFDRLEGKLMWNGFYLRYGGDFPVLYADEFDVSLDLLNEVVTTAADIGLFDRYIYENYLVLTEKRYQQIYLKQRWRSKTAIFVPAYLLINPSDEGFVCMTEPTDKLMKVEYVRDADVKSDARKSSKSRSEASFDIDLYLEQARHLDPTKTKRTD